MFDYSGQPAERVRQLHLTQDLKDPIHGQKTKSGKLLTSLLAQLKHQQNQQRTRRISTRRATQSYRYERQQSNQTQQAASGRQNQIRRKECDNARVKYGIGGRVI